MTHHIPWDLILVYLKGECTVDEETQIRQWLADPAHQEVFAELKTLWEETQKEASKIDPDVSAYWKKMEDRMNRKAEKQFVFSSVRLRKMLAVASILLILALSASFFLGRENGSLINSGVQSYTALGGKSKILLPDGSVVWLNTGSQLDYSTSFLRDRQIKLDGEALFDVTKSHRPFVVDASGLKVKVHGTRFNVNTYGVNDNIQVTLFRGSVSVLTDNHKEKFLIPGEMATFDKKECSLQIVKADVGFESFWANESVRFEAQPLSQIYRYLEKWYNVKIDLDPSIPDTQAYTFTIRKDDPLEMILRIISSINPITYTFENDKQVKIMNVEH